MWECVWKVQDNLVCGHLDVIHFRFLFLFTLLEIGVSHLPGTQHVG